jgi:hypothetical protein
MNNYVHRKNLHLIISVIIVFPVAIVYGFFTDLFFNVNADTIDELNIYKAIMGFYVAFVGLWFYGIVYDHYWKIATISNVLFMIGLGLGRIISIIIDGMPSPIFILGTVGELALSIYGCYYLRKQSL